MNIQKSAGIKADTFILKRNNMDRWIRMDVAMLIILAICTRLVAGIMNVEKMDAYTGSGEGFCKAVSESHGVDMVKDCFELGTQKVLDVKKTAKSVCKSVTIKKTMQDVIRPTETEEIIPEVKGVPEAKDGKAAWANMDSAKTETITQETVTDKSVPESITGKINPGSHCRRNYYCFDGVGSNADTGIWKSADGRNCNRRNHAIGTGTCFCKCNP